MADGDARPNSPPQAAAATNGDVTAAPEDWNDIPDAPAEWQVDADELRGVHGMTLSEVASLTRRRSNDVSSGDACSSNRVNLSRGSQDLSDFGA